MGKKKKQKHILAHENEEYDYSDIHYNGDIRKLMNDFADAIEGYLDSVNTYYIFEGVNEESWKKMKKKTKKLIKKLRQGDPSVFNIRMLNEVIESDNSIYMG